MTSALSCRQNLHLLEDIYIPIPKRPFQPWNLEMFQRCESSIEITLNADIPMPKTKSARIILNITRHVRIQDQICRSFIAIDWPIRRCGIPSSSRPRIWVKISNRTSPRPSVCLENSNKTLNITICPALSELLSRIHIKGYTARVLYIAIEGLIKYHTLRHDLCRSRVTLYILYGCLSCYFILPVSRH
jgi:hypothetical protein